MKHCVSAKLAMRPRPNRNGAVIDFPPPPPVTGAELSLGVVGMTAEHGQWQ